MSNKTIIILYWTINIAFVIGVLIVNDNTAKESALIWLIICAAIFLVGVILHLIYKRK